MEIRIEHFHGYGAREAKAKVFKHFRNTQRQNWHYYHELDEMTGTARFGGVYLAHAWTGRHVDGPQFPLWLWKWVAGLKNRRLSDRLIRTMKSISGIK